MSTDYDQFRFDATVAGSPDTNMPFKDVSRIELSDVNLGSYQSGQIKFNTSTLQSSEAFVDFSKSHLVIPLSLKLSAANATGGVGAGLKCDSASGKYTATLKNCFLSLLDSVTISCNNTELVSRSTTQLGTIMTYRLMQEWNATDLAVEGASLGFYMDDWRSWTNTVADAAIGEANNRVLGESASQIIDQGYSSTGPNRGRIIRHYKTVTSLIDAVDSQFFTAANLIAAQRSHTSDVTAASSTQTFNIQAILPLKYIHPFFASCPLTRGGSYTFLFNTHVPSSCTIVTLGDGSAQKVPSSTSFVNNVCPFMISQFSADVGIVQTATTLKTELTIGNTMQSVCTLRLNMVTLQNDHEKTIINSPKKTLKYDDVYGFVDQFSLAPGATCNQLFSVNISKLRRLIIIPRQTTNGYSGSLIANPHQSMFTSSPLSTCPCSLTNLQLYLAGKPLYSQPISWSWEQYLLEEGSMGVNGNAVNSISAGLIDQQMFQSIFGFVSINLARHDVAADLIERSISVSFQNNSRLNLTFSCYLWFQREWDYDVSSGKIWVV
jgi:hypothetical protein